MTQRVNFLSQSVSKPSRYKNFRWPLGLVLCVLVLVLVYLGWPDLVVPSKSGNENRSQQIHEYQALQDKQRLLTSWTAQRGQVSDAIHHIAKGWPSPWALAPRPVLSLTSLHVSAQEVRLQALSRGVPELPRWDPKSAPLPSTSSTPSNSNVPLSTPIRPTLGPPELLELTHAAPAAASGSPQATYLVSVRFPWQLTSDTSSQGSVTPSTAQDGDFQDRLAALRQSVAHQESESMVSSDLSTMVADLQQGLNQAGLEVQSLKPGASEIKGSWIRCPIALKATGSLSSLMKFLVAASHRPGVVALTPLSLVRQGSIDRSQDREPSDTWTMDLTVSRVWHPHAAIPQRPLHPWSFEEAKVQSALQGLLPTGSQGAVPQRTHNPLSHGQRVTPFESDLQALRDQVGQAQLAWVGFMASQGTERALIRWNGRVSEVLVGERLSSGPWKVVRASASGADLAWLGAEALANPVHTEVQVGPRGVLPLFVSRGAP